MKLLMILEIASLYGKLAGTGGSQILLLGTVRKEERAILSLRKVNRGYHLVKRSTYRIRYFQGSTPDVYSSPVQDSHILYLLLDACFKSTVLHSY